MATEADLAKAVSRVTADRFFLALDSPEMHAAVEDLLFMLWTGDDNGMVPLAEWPASILAVVRDQLGAA